MHHISSKMPPVAPKVSEFVNARSSQARAFQGFIKFFAFPLLSLAAPAAHAEVGFGTTFAPGTWLVVNTNPSQSLTFPDNACNFTDVEGAGTNGVACIANYTDKDVSLLGSSVIDPLDPTSGTPPSGSGSADTARSTTLQFYNSNWRPALITFKWTFHAADSTPDDPTIPLGQFVSFLVDPGWTDPSNGPGTYSYTSTIDTLYEDIDQTVYLPSGATLSFSVNTVDNNNLPGILYIKGFTTTEVPAPLPIMGASGVLL